MYKPGGGGGGEEGKVPYKKEGVLVVSFRD